MAKKVSAFDTRQDMILHSFEIYRYRDSYLNEVALHHHDFYEIYLFLSGNVNYTVESRNYSLMPGDLLIISPQELHRPIITPGKAPYERMVLWVDAAFLDQFSTPQTNIDRSIDTMLRSILLLFVSRKPLIQGICPVGVFKILCIAGFFCVMEFLRYSRFKAQFEYP